MSSCKVYVYSAEDDRPTKLFPCFCDDNGAVDAFAVENFAHRCYYDSCGGCSYSMELADVPVKFLRLGSKSRALVMSLYRAIVERFYIMRATGCGCSPFGCTSGRSFDFCRTFLAGLCDSRKRDIAGANRRRAFGGVFRDTISQLAHTYIATGGAATVCGVFFYPYTPYISNRPPDNNFLPCAKEYANEQPITWWPCSTCNQPAFAKILKTEREDCYGCEAAWVLDNSMQRFGYCYYTCSFLRPLLRDVVDAYKQHMSRCDGIDRYGEQAHYHRLLDPRLQSISELCSDSELARVCHITAFEQAIRRFSPCGGDVTYRFSLPALAIALRMLSTLNAQTVRRCGNIAIPHKRLTANFTMPMGTAGRSFMVGPERSCFLICDLRLPYAVACADLSYSNGFASYRAVAYFYNLDDRSWPPEYCCVTTEVPVYACVCIGCYCDEGAPSYPHYKCVCIGCYCDEGTECAYPHYTCVFCGCHPDPFPHYECRCIGSSFVDCTRLNPGYYCITSACWSEWGTRAVCTGPQGDHCASVTMRAIWPDLSSGSGFHFGGAAYPARWAVMECNVAFGAVSAFVKDESCRKHAWVVNKTDHAKLTLGVCKDLMTVLGRGLIRAGIQRAMCDQTAGGEVCGNTFSGTCFPTTCAGVKAEMVGQNHDANVAALYCAAGSSGSSGRSGGWEYHHIKVFPGSSIVGYKGSDMLCGDTIVPYSGWSDGTWLNLAFTCGGSLYFNYTNDYQYQNCGGCGGCSCGCDCSCGSGGHLIFTCERHGWSLARSAVQFGGFFGTFVFNNRAARQQTRQQT